MSTHDKVRSPEEEAAIKMEITKLNEADFSQLFTTIDKGHDSLHRAAFLSNEDARNRDQYIESQLKENGSADSAALLEKIKEFDAVKNGVRGEVGLQTTFPDTGVMQRAKEIIDQMRSAAHELHLDIGDVSLSSERFRNDHDISGSLKQLLEKARHAKLYELRSQLGEI